LLESINIFQCASFSDEALIAIVVHAGSRHNLRKPDITDTVFTYTGLGSASWGCPLLEELVADMCGTVGSVVKATARGCPLLRRFSGSDAEAPVAESCLEGTMIFLGDFDEDSDDDFSEESDMDDTVLYGGIWVPCSCGKGGLNSYFCHIVVPCYISNVRREKGVRALFF
jgi:hypothetical protein